jgi:predicted metal-dependent peptidase
LKDEKEKWEKQNKQNSQCKTCGGTGKDPKQDQGQGNKPCPDCGGTGNKDGKDSTGKPAYGPYGKNPGKEGGDLDTWSKEQIFQDIENGSGEYLDKHIGDEVSEEMRDAIVKDVMEKLAARGLAAGNVETTLNKLRKKRKDYLREIKRAVSNMVFGTIKQKTIVKPNRRQISGLKGNRKVKTKINVLIDTSGSMSGLIEKVLNYVYKNNIEMNLLECDTQVKYLKNIKDSKKLDRIPVLGGGGTILMPGIKYIEENFNTYPSLILTDGFCDNLDLSNLKEKILIISIGVKVPISKSNGKVKQILVEKTE